MSSISGAMSSAGQSRPIRASRAAPVSGEVRMRRITSSMLATAMARPTCRGAAARALARRNLVRRVTTSSRKSMKATRKSLRFSISGRPPFSAIMLAPKEDWSWLKR